MKPCQSMLLVVLVFAGPNCMAQLQGSKRPIESPNPPELNSSGRPSPTGASWQRYTPRAFGLSLELTGEPTEQSYPIPKELRSRILEFKALSYFGEGFYVNFTHFVFVEAADVKWMAEEMSISLSDPDSRDRPKISPIPPGDRVRLEFTYEESGIRVELQTLIIGSGRDAWTISVQTRQDNPEGAGIASRILGSAIITR
jgi:hypothetical protein